MNKAARTRERARKARQVALGISDKQRQHESNISEAREILLSAEEKARLQDMRDAGFAPPRGMPTVKQFSRYAAFRNAAAASNRGALIDEETAVLRASGGVMQMILERMQKPGIKDTAFANLVVAATRIASMAPSLVDADQRISIASDHNITTDEEIVSLASELGVKLD